MKVIVVMPAAEANADVLETIAASIQLVKGNPFAQYVPGGIKGVRYLQDAQVGETSLFSFDVEQNDTTKVHPQEIILMAYMEIHRDKLNWTEISTGMLGDLIETHQIYRQGRRFTAPAGHPTLFIYEPISTKRIAAPLKRQPAAPIIVNNLEVDPDFEGEVSPFKLSDVIGELPVPAKPVEPPVGMTAGKALLNIPVIGAALKRAQLPAEEPLDETYALRAE